MQAADENGPGIAPHESSRAWILFLIELLIVVAIILIIAAIALPNFIRARMAANEAAAASKTRTITTAAVVYSSRVQQWSASVTCCNGPCICRHRRWGLLRQRGPDLLRPGRGQRPEERISVRLYRSWSGHDHAGIRVLDTGLFGVSCYGNAWALGSLTSAASALFAATSRSVIHFDLSGTPPDCPLACATLPTLQ